MKIIWAALKTMIYINRQPHKKIMSLNVNVYFAIYNPVRIWP